LDETGLKATFFAEARALQNMNAEFGKNEVAMHGLDHEDMTGEVSGVRLSEDALKDIMMNSIDIIRGATGSTPTGFRAPYMRTNGTVMNILSKLRLRYDSSLYADIKETMHPYDLGNGMKEIPVPVATDGNGRKLYAYLWPMHEGLRTPDEYIRMAETVKEGTFVIATHSWHMVESRSGMMSADQIKKNADNVRKIITSILDSGFKAVRMTDVVG
jgi:peptidoglycan/xylan/chitin deacetylase (PgdA/CDA1 family)